jgi:hypothetical protein
MTIDDVRQAAREHEATGHRLRLTVTAALAAELPIAAIAKAAGVTRQTVYNWSAAYGRGRELAVSASTLLEDLPVQRPQAVRGAPVLILSRRRGKWDGRIGKAITYAGDELGVSIPGKIVDVIASSWALAGDSSGAGRRPSPGDLVICQDGALRTVTTTTAADGDIEVETDAQVSSCSWWAIVLPAD